MGILQINETDEVLDIVERYFQVQYNGIPWGVKSRISGKILTSKLDFIYLPDELAHVVNRAFVGTDFRICSMLYNKEASYYVIKGKLNNYRCAVKFIFKNERRCKL